MKNCFAIVFFLHIMFVFSQNRQEDNCLIFNLLHTMAKQEKLDFFAEKIENRFITIVEKLKNVEKIKNFKKADSIKKVGLVSDKIEKLYPVFTMENYDYILSQRKENTKKWDLENCNPKLTFTNEENAFYASAPIYSKDQKFAFVTIRHLFNYYIHIFYKEENTWKSGHIIFFCFYDIKAKDCIEYQKI